MRKQTYVGKGYCPFDLLSMHTSFSVMLVNPIEKKKKKLTDNG